MQITIELTMLLFIILLCMAVAITIPVSLVVSLLFITQRSLVIFESIAIHRDKRDCERRKKEDCPDGLPCAKARIVRGAIE